MPSTRSTRSPAIDSRTGRTIGMAPATAASKYRSTPCSSAAAYSVGPSSASSALFAVTTEAPCAIACRISERAGSMPPMTSTTRSAPVTRSLASVVNSSAGTPLAARSRPVRRTAMPTSSSRRPTRAASSSACVVNSRATCVPTTPQPSNATRSGSPAGSTAGRSAGAGTAPPPCLRRSLSPSSTLRAPAGPGSGTADRRSPHVEGEEVVFGLAAQQHPDLAVADGEHRRARHVVVLVGQAAAVGPRAGHGEQVAGADVGRKELVLDDDVAALAVLADDPRQQRAGVRASAGERRRVVGVVEGGADVVTHAAVDRDVPAGAAAVEPDVLRGPHGVEGEGAGPGDGAAGLGRDARDVDAEFGALLADDVGHAACQLGRRQR